MKTKYRLLTLLLITSHFLFSQQKWSKEFGENNRYDMTGKIIQTYDGGIILLSYYYYIVNGKYQKYAWLIKTDVNGNLLWDKVIDYPGSHYIWPMGITETFDHGYVIVGMVVDEASNVYPIVFKLNKCMTIEWSQIYIDANNISTPSFPEVVELSDHSLILYAFAFGDINNETAMLFKLTPQGNLIWKKVVCSGYEHPVKNPFAFSMKVNSENNIFMAGYGYWQNILRPIAWEVDSSANELWVKAITETNQIGEGFAGIYTTEGPMLFGYSDINEEAGDLSVMFNNEGLVSSISLYSPNSINDDFTDCYTTNVVELRNKKIFKGLHWRYDGLSNWAPTPTMIYTTAIDDLFNEEFTFQDSVVNNDLFGIGQYHQLTKDSTQILSTYDIPCGGSGRNIYFTKYNSDLTEAPIDTTPYEYDTACPFGIESGFIVLDQCVPVSTKDTPNPNEYYAYLKTIPVIISPNPASRTAKIELKNTEYHNNITLEITDLTGKKISSQKILKSQTETTLNVASWEKGIYFVIIRAGGEVVGRSKFVVD